MKTLACVEQFQSAFWKETIKDIELTVRQSRVKLTIHESKRWEYPWTWKVLEQLMPVKGGSPRVLDIGSRKSPFPWWLIKQGYIVTVSDIFSLSSLKYWLRWRKAEKNLGIRASKRLMDARRLPIPDESFDVYLSTSVLEHIRGKEQALAEANRVLRPGGLMILTFDIVEPAMGMAAPAKYESLNMETFDRIFWNSNQFVPVQPQDEWNIGAIPGFLEWMRQRDTNYVVAGAAFIKKD